MDLYISELCSLMRNGAVVAVVLSSAASSVELDTLPCVPVCWQRHSVCLAEAPSSHSVHNNLDVPSYCGKELGEGKKCQRE